MNSVATKCCLGEILCKSSQSIQPDPQVEYAELTVRLWGKGVVERRRVLGAAMAGGRRRVARQGQFVLSRIDAKSGAMGIVPASLDGALVSNDFPLFDIDTNRINPEYLLWLTCTPEFLELCNAASMGTTNRIRLKEEQFLALEVSLPSLPDQLKIVTKIASITPLLEITRNAHRDSVTLTNEVLQSVIGKMFSKLADTAICCALGDRLTRNRTLRPLLANIEYMGLGTRMWGQGVYVHEVRSGSSFSAERYNVRPHQLVYNEVWAHNGALGIVPDVSGDLVVSRHFHVFDVDWEGLEPEYLTRLFQSSWFWNKCQGGTVSTTGRGHLRRDHFLAIEIPIPSTAEQQSIVKRLAALEGHISTLQKAQKQRAMELDALLPAILDKAFRGGLLTP